MDCAMDIWMDLQMDTVYMDIYILHGFISV